jgi:hypothetical protein
MRWMLEVAFIGLSTSWKWLLGSTAAVAILVGLLFGVGVLDGGDSSDTDTDGPFVAAPPTPTPAPKATPRPTQAVAATPVPSATRVPAAPAKVISVPILATRAANVGSLEFVLVYDPAKLEFAQVERGLLSGDALIDSSSSEPGRLWAGIIDMQGINGSGPVAVVKFRVRDGVSGAMPLSLESIAAFDANTLVDIVTGTTAGEFNVTELHPLSPIVTFQ